MKYIIIIALSFCLISCKKEYNVVIQAEDYITGDGSAYAGMAFSITQSRPAWNKDKVTNVYQGVLDENGHAAFELKMHKDWSYILSINQPDDICYGGITFYYLENEDNNLVNFNYLKCSEVNLPRVNVNCEDENDRFRYKYYYTADPEIYTYIGYLDADKNWDPEDYLEGCIDYSTAVSYNSRPEGHYTIEWMVERTSGTSYGSDTFVLTAGDSLTYLIEY